MGDFEAATLVVVESSLKYHPDYVEVLTQVRYPDRGQCVVGSLTGAVSSQRVTEEYEGTLSMVGNHAMRIKAEVCLTASPTGRAGTKVGLSDPVVLYGRAIAQRIKGTTNDDHPGYGVPWDQVTGVEHILLRTRSIKNTFYRKHIL